MKKPAGMSVAIVLNKKSDEAVKSEMDSAKADVVSLAKEFMKETNQKAKMALGEEIKSLIDEECDLEPDTEDTNEDKETE